MIENETFKKLKDKKFQNDSVDDLRKAGIFVPKKPESVLFDAPNDLSEIADNMLANFLVNYESHSGWIRYCISLREIELDKFKKLYQIGKDMLSEQFSKNGAKSTDIKSLIGADESILEVEENILKISSDIKLMQATLEHIVNISKAISREITIRGYTNESYSYNRTKTSLV